MIGAYWAFVLVCLLFQLVIVFFRTVFCGKDFHKGVCPARRARCLTVPLLVFPKLKKGPNSTGGGRRFWTYICVRSPSGKSEMSALPCMTRKKKNNLHGLCEKSYRKSARDRLQEFWNVFEKEDRVLVCFTADPDALACAMAVKRLLRYRVKRVILAHPNEIRRLNNIAMTERLKIPLERLKNVRKRDFDKAVLVDSQPGHSPAFEKISYNVVIDHHPLAGEWDTPITSMFAPITAPLQPCWWSIFARRT